MADATPRAPLAPVLAARATDFARACKAAARTFSMYPDGHPAVHGALTRLVGSIGKATQSGALTLTVLNERLMVNGAEPERPDPAIGELASLLYGHLVGQLVIEAPGNLVRLSNDEVAVVLRVHAPDPYRPKVKVILDNQGQELPTPRESNLWELAGGEHDLSIVAPLDPAEHGIDPLELIDPA